MASYLLSLAGLIVCVALVLVLEGCGTPTAPPAQSSAEDLQIQKQEETIQGLKDTIRAHDALAKDVEGKLRASLATTNSRIQSTEKQLQKTASQKQQLQKKVDAESAASQTTESELREKVEAAQEQDKSDVKAADAQLEKAEKDLRGQIEAAQEKDKSDAKAKDAQLEKTEKDLRGQIAAAQEKDTSDVKAKDAQLETAEKDLRRKVEAAQEQDKHDEKVEDAQLENQEQANKHLQVMLKKDDEAKTENAKLQSGLVAAKVQLRKEKANDAMLLRRAKSQLEEGQAIMFGSAGAVVAFLIVAAFASGVAYRKHKALGKAVKDLASSKAQHGQLEEPLMQSEKDLGKDGGKEAKQSHVTVV